MEYLDDMFSQFAVAFIGNMEGEGNIPYRDVLNAVVLDYSLNSLKEVDKYLRTTSNFMQVLILRVRKSKDLSTFKKLTNLPVFTT